MKRLGNIFQRLTKPATFSSAQRVLYFKAISSDNSAQLQELLIEAPALLNATYSGTTSTPTPEFNGLHYAASTGSLQCLKLLHKSGIDPEALDSDGYRAIDWAATPDNYPCFSYLLEHNKQPVDAVNVKGESLLALAMDNKATSAILHLLQKGASEENLPDGITPLMQAARRGDSAFAEALFVLGVNANARDAEGRTALWYAVDSGDLALASLIQSKGGDYAAVTNHGENLLMTAVKAGADDIVEWLAVTLVPVNTRDNAGNTPLHYMSSIAADLNNIVIAEKLLRKGAWIDAGDNAGRSLLDKIKAHGQKPELEAVLTAALTDPAVQREPQNIERFHDGTAREMTPLRTVRFKAGSGLNA